MITKFTGTVICTPHFSADHVCLNFNFEEPMGVKTESSQIAHDLAIATAVLAYRSLVQISFQSVGPQSLDHFSCSGIWWTELLWEIWSQSQLDI